MFDDEISIYIYEQHFKLMPANSFTFSKKIYIPNEYFNLSMEKNLSPISSFLIIIQIDGDNVDRKKWRLWIKWWN